MKIVVPDGADILISSRHGEVTIEIDEGAPCLRDVVVPPDFLNQYAPAYGHLSNASDLT